ncbi:Protein CBG19579 [Caenorhabditis briggsae]|uniref:Protein CBG19579 n=2 Tax=Caenorhabditis briggsae TaxID=6238 RepID=A8XVY1_CAEBR|nr:Protein CBG19579 [Caenorhabditis briggsae]CAP36800.2 Protein CBG19579 [Caenorhabditis briggsae]
MPRLQPVPELNRIKLLKFPSLATEMIIKEMDFVDALQLSLSSSRCKRMTSWARNRTPVGKTEQLKIGIDMENSSQNSTNSTSDDSCDSDRCLALVAEIGPMIRTHTEVKPKSEVLKKMNNLCTEIKSCFKAATCKKGKHTYESMRDACDHLELMTGNVQPCLKKFYSAVYHEKYNCTSDKYYLTEDLPKRRESYTLGRFCFFEVIEKECSAETVKILSSNFNYDNLINVLTTLPGGLQDNCNRLYHSFNKLQCESLEEAIAEKEKEIDWVDTTQTNDTDLVQFLQMFKDAEKCIAKSCSYNDIHRLIFKSKKDWFELYSTEFFMCKRKMMLDKPSAQKFPCLGDHNIVGSKKDETCERYSKLKDCTKKVMEDVCGKKAIEDYDKTADIIKKHFDCK